MISKYPTTARWLRGALNFLSWSLLFSLAYTQSPLYSSNQNQYFLHGLAQAGFGSLDQDWLANTSDPTPLFSLLVQISYHLFENSVIFYIYYSLLLGIYFYTLLAIAGLLIDDRQHRLNRLLLAALLNLIHSAGWRFLLSRTLGVNWMYILEDGVADQRMLGPVFQPSTFGVFLLVSLYLFLSRRDVLGGLAAAAACLFHPTYLLGAGLLITAVTIIRWVETHHLLIAMRPMLILLVGAIPILLYTLTTFGLSNGEIATQARLILVDYRIPHHARVFSWLDATVAAKLLLILSALFVLKPPIYASLRFASSNLRPNKSFSPRQSLGLILAVVSLAALALTILQTFSGELRLALLFPWRISILLVPVSSLVLLVTAIQSWLKESVFARPAGRQIIILFSMLMIFLSVLVGLVRLKLDNDRKIAEPERLVQNFIYTNPQPGNIYLIPTKMQDFRITSGAPAYIDFKSIPYAELDVLEWYQRQNTADKYYSRGDCAIPTTLAQRRLITHVIQPAEISPCKNFESVYQDTAYSIYRIKAIP
jgi:hypothetical protein